MNLNTLYKLIDGNSDPMIEVVGGSITLYTWLNEPTSTPVSDDFNSFESVSSEKISAFDVLPKYLYAVQDTGTTTAINLSGCRVEAV